jgi:hypothetical protein
MKNLTIKLDTANGSTGSFRSNGIKTKGQIRYRYTVHGSQEMIELYEQAQGEYYAQKDDGTPLFYSAMYLGDRNELQIITVNDELRVASGNTFLEKLDNLCAQYPGLAKTEAGLQMLIAKIGNGAGAGTGAGANSGAGAGADNGAGADPDPQGIPIDSGADLNEM